MYELSLGGNLIRWITWTWTSFVIMLNCWDTGLIKGFYLGNAHFYMTKLTCPMKQQSLIFNNKKWAKSVAL